jgi:hypothetical protein
MAGAQPRRRAQLGLVTRITTLAMLAIAALVLGAAAQSEADLVATIAASPDAVQPADPVTEPPAAEPAPTPPPPEGSNSSTGTAELPAFSALRVCLPFNVLVQPAGGLNESGAHAAPMWKLHHKLRSLTSPPAISSALQHTQATARW